MKKMREWYDILKKFPILPVITAGLAVLLILSYLFPNQVLDTYVMNISGEENRNQEITLPEGSVISYFMNTGSRPLRGIQPGISIQGGMFEQGVLRYRVYRNGEEQPVSDNVYSLKQLSHSLQQSIQTLNGNSDFACFFEGQYTYLPFENYEECLGEVRVDFWYESNGEQAEPMELPAALLQSKEIVPAITCNEVQKDGTVTKLDGKKLEGGITGYYVYTHNTYPLVYDLKLLVFFFMAVTACAPIIRKKNREELQ